MKTNSKHSLAALKPLMSTRLYHVLARQGIDRLDRLPGRSRFDPYARVGYSLGVRAGCWKGYGWCMAHELDLLLSSRSIPHVTLASTPRLLAFLTGWRPSNPLIAP
jgi:hypothetical protein